MTISPRPALPKAALETSLGIRAGLNTRPHSGERKTHIMGCDIHLHTEVKIDGIWHHYSCPDMIRDYRVFRKMADVRNFASEVEPLAEPRGFPPGTTFLTRFDYNRWADTSHSASWLSAEEIVQLTKYIKEEVCPENAHDWCAKNLGSFFGLAWGSCLKYRGEPAMGIPKEVDDMRFVFWFDD